MKGISNFLTLLMLALIGLISLPIYAETGGAIAGGWGTSHISPLRLTLQQSICGFWNPDPARIWPFRSYLDGSFYYLGQSGSGCNRHHRYRRGAGHLKAYTLGGFFRFSRDPTFLNAFAWPYIDVGLSLGWLTKDAIAGRRLGMNFQVETKLGAGIRFGNLRQFDLGYRFTNFSNGFLKHPNNTVNLHMIVFTYWYYPC